MCTLIEESTSSPRLRQTLASLMLDACTGKVCSLQRVAIFAGDNDLIVAGAKFLVSKNPLFVSTFFL